MEHSVDVTAIRTIFLRLLDTPPEGRDRVLQECCGSDLLLRRAVEELLDAHLDADGFLRELARRARVPMATFVSAPGPEGRRVGAYRLVRELGRGGMGAVYLAERADDRFEKQVAIKLLPLGPGGANARERFMDERRTLAQLEHPGIARLIDAGIDEDGTPFFIMEYVAGEPITDHCDRTGASIEERLRLFLQVCDAVDYAHGRQVVHRDLKPDNILVTPEGVAKLLDFGIAKVLEGQTAQASTLTQFGGSPLTPSCASPEQVSGGAVGFTSDVYQLGVLLHQLLTGHGPYAVSTSSPEEVRRAILECVPILPSRVCNRPRQPAARPGAPPADIDSVSAAELAGMRGTTPSRLRDRLRGNLDCIVLKALRREPQDRYESVAAFALDIRRHLDGDSVLALPEPGYLRARRWLARRSRAAAGLAAAMILLLGGMYGNSLLDRPISLTRDTALTSTAAGAPDASVLSTRSLVAYRFYQEALGAYYQGRSAVAYPLFAAAVREDSAFALAWYYLARSAPDQREMYDHIDRAHRLSSRAPERERLLIRAQWAEVMSDPSLREAAETLAVRYPDDVNGHYLVGLAKVRATDLLGALPHFERVVAMDSSSFGEAGTLCRACDALGRMVSLYVAADSLAAAERTARRWTRLQPGSALAWHQLAWTLWRQERGSEALAARHESTMRRETNAEDQIYPAVVALRLGDYSSADALLAERIRNATPEVRRTALWWQTISFRYQGRLREALATARHYRQRVDAETEASHIWQSVSLEAHVLFEMGNWNESATLIDSAATVPFRGVSASRTAQHRVWVLTHAQTVAMGAGDTARVRLLADSIETLGRESGFVRDHRLHLYGRAMLLARQGDTDAAAAAFRTVTNPSYFARADLEFARLLIANGQPDEATALLHATLRGPIAAGGFYVTRTELHALLGRAWDAAGRPDSAAANYRRAIAAWQRADPEFAEQRADVERRLADLPR